MSLSKVPSSSSIHPLLGSEDFHLVQDLLGLSRPGLHSGAHRLRKLGHPCVELGKLVPSSHPLCHGPGCQAFHPHFLHQHGIPHSTSVLRPLGRFRACYAEQCRRVSTAIYFACMKSMGARERLQHGESCPPLLSLDL